MNFISKELSVKLKDIGFNAPCIAHYRNFDIEPTCQMYATFKTEQNSDFGDPTNYWLSAPTYEEVKMWFMEKHLIFITVNCEAWLHEFMGEVETADGLSKLKTVGDYHEAFAMAIEEAIKLKISEEK